MLDAYKEFKKDFRGVITWIGYSILIYFIIQSIFIIFKIDYDGTDSKLLGKSGVSLRTDYGTGCQYLESSHGYIIPRMDADGKHICTLEDN